MTTEAREEYTLASAAEKNAHARLLNAQAASVERNNAERTILESAVLDALAALEEGKQDEAAIALTAATIALGIR